MVKDQAARTAACAVTNSWIVQAPAGSGKTSLLVQRFINLLAICQDPKECVAITFTKKAAREMRYRVFRALEKIVLEQPEISANFPAVLSDSSKLQILTIDGFCAKLIQKMPILAKCGDFVITEDPENLYKLAADRLLSRVETTDPLSAAITESLIKLLQYLNNDHELIQKLLVDLLAKREQWLPLIVPISLNYKRSTADQKQEDQLRSILEDHLKIAIEELLIDLKAYLPNSKLQAEILQLGKYAGEHLEEGQDPLIASLKNLTNSWPQATCQELYLWQGLTRLLLTSNGNPRLTVSNAQGFNAPSAIKDPAAKIIAHNYKARMQAVLKKLALTNKEFLKKLARILKLPDPQYHPKNWDVLKALFTILPELVAHLLVVFAEQLTVDFTQITVTALAALGSTEAPSDLGMILDQQIKHILVDEFQDTSILHFTLLEKLVANWHPGDGKTLFIVGDPLQSIYRFRQADVSLFLRVQQYGIGPLKLASLYLTTNFRASGAMVTETNKLFTGIFPKNNDLLLGEIAYIQADPKEGIVPEIFAQAAPINLWLTTDLEQEARVILSLIKKLKNTKADLKIAILCRAKAQVKTILAKLSEEQIAYQADQLESWQSKAAVSDLGGLLKAILHLNDRIAWLALLRGPLVGLKLVDLDHLCGDFGELKDQPLWQQIQNYKNMPLLSQDAIIRLEYVVPILLQAIVDSQVDKLAVVVKKTWLALGGELLVDPKDLSLVEELLLAVAKFSDLTVRQELDRLIDKAFVRIHPAKMDPQAVQLLTIHKAKGLEFDIVILPGMEQGRRNADHQLLLWEARSKLAPNKLDKTNLLDQYLLVSPIKAYDQASNNIYDFLRSMEYAKDLCEAKRLLYVAITRAKYQFYGLAKASTKHSQDSFVKFLTPQLNFTEVPEEFLADDRVSTPHQLPTKPLVNLYRLPTAWYLQRSRTVEKI